jgi:hypothetical protein
LNHFYRRSSAFIGVHRRSSAFIGVHRRSSALICGSKAQNRNWRKSGGDEKSHPVPLHKASSLAMTCHRLNPVEEDLTGIASLCYKRLNPESWPAWLVSYGWLGQRVW